MENKIKLKYGIFLGKYAKVWHIGHQSNVDKIKEDGLEPIIFIGSAQYFNTKACPLHIQDRMKMIDLVNPYIRIYALEDMDDWEAWVAKFIDALKLVVSEDLEEVVVYTHNKPEDLMDFEYKGVKYINEYYSKVFEIEGLNVKNLPLSGIDIRGTKVNEDLEGNKKFLDPKVYEFLKELK